MPSGASAIVSSFFVVAALTFFHGLNDWKVMGGRYMTNVKRSMSVQVRSPRRKSAQNVTGSAPVRFLLLVGLEGTGHHLWKNVSTNSPWDERIRELGIDPANVKKQMYSKENPCETGLFSTNHCTQSQKKAPVPNTKQMAKDLVRAMKSIERQARHPVNNTHLRATKENPLYFPINVLKYALGGMMSYPNFKNTGRALQYPYVDIWLDACHDAGLACELVYIYRDPHAVIRSTTQNRKMNDHNPLTALQLYLTMLSVMYRQLASHPDHIAGCWNYDRVLAEDEGHHESIRDVWEWRGKKNDKNYKRTMSNVYKEPKPMTKAEQESIVPKGLDPYMDSMVSVSNDVVQLCHRLYEENKSRSAPKPYEV